MALPPGPRLPGAVQSVWMVTAQANVEDRLQRRYGDVFRLHGMGFKHLIILSNPEHVKDLFKTDPRVAHAGEGNRILKPILGDHSVLVLDEDEHMRQRKLMLPSFHGERI